MRTNNRTTTRPLSDGQVIRWMKDRTVQGVLHEENGSCDTLDDAGGFQWNCQVSTKDGRKTVLFTTNINPVPFASGTLTDSGKPRITWN